MQAYTVLYSILYYTLYSSGSTQAFSTRFTTQNHVLVHYFMEKGCKILYKKLGIPKKYFLY